MNLEQLPNQPGDIIRDRRDDTDYVIQSIIGLGMGVGFSVYAIGLFNRKFASWEFPTSQAMADDIITIRNSKGQDPKQVLDFFDKKVSEAFGKNREIIQKLGDPENKAFKDLFLLGMDDDLDFLPRRFVDIAESLVDITRELPSKDDIFTILRESTDPSRISDDALDYISKSITQAARNRLNSSKFLISKASTLQQLFIGPDGRLGGDVFSLAKMRTQKKLPFTDVEKTIIKDFLGGFQNGRELGLGGTELADIANLPVEQRIEKIAATMFQEMGGSYSGVTKEYVKRNIQRVRKGVQRGNFDNSLTEVLARYITNPELNSALKKRYETFAKNNKTPFPWYDEQVLSEGRILRQQRNRGTAYRGPRTLAGFNKDLDLDKLLSRIGSEKDVKISIGANAFFHSVLGNSRLKFRRLEGTLSNTRILNALDELLPPDPNFIVSARQLRIINEARKKGQVVDLDEIINMAGEYRELVDESTRVELGKKHGLSYGLFNSITESGDPAVVLTGLEEKLLSGPEDVLKQWGMPDSEMQRIWALKNPDALEFTGSKDLTNLIKGSKVDLDENLFYLDTNDPAIIEQYNSPSSITSDLSFSLKKVSDVTFIDSKSPKGRINSLRQLTSTRGRAMIKDQLKISSEVDLVEAFISGYQSNKIALASIRKGGETSVKLMGSDVNQSLERQLQLVSDFYKGKGALLDIETSANTDLFIRELSFGSVTNGKFETMDFYPKSAGDLADALVSIAKSLESVHAVGTQSGYDFRELIRQTQILQDKLPGRVEELSGAIEIFGKIQESKLFDIQTAYQAVGYELGATRQNLVSLGELGTTEKHTANQDIIDAYNILKKIESDFSSSSFEFHRGTAIGEKSPIFYDNNTLSPSAGKLKQLMDIKVQKDSANEEKIVGIFKEWTSEGGKLTPTDNFFTQTARSASELGALISKYGTQVDQSAWDNLAASHSNLLEDYASRDIRSLNPSTATIYDHLAMFNPKKDGPFGAFKLAYISQAKEMFPNVEKSYENLKHLFLAERGLESLPMEFAPEMEKLAAQAIDNQLGNRFLTREGEKSLGRIYVEDTLKTALLDKSQNRKLFQYGLGSFADTPAGQALLKAAKSSSSSEGKTGYYELLYHDLIAKAAKSNLVKRETQPRFGLVMGAEAASTYFANINDTTKMADILNNLSSEVLFSLPDKKSSPIRDVLAEKFDVEQLMKQAEAYKEKYHTTDSLDDWKAAIHRLGFEGDPQFQDLRRARGYLANSDYLKNSVLTELHEKLSQIQTLESEELKTRATSLGERLIQSVETADSNLTDAVAKSFYDAAKSDKDAFNALMRETYLEPQLGTLDSEVVAETVRETRSLYKQIVDVANKDIDSSHLLQNIIEEMAYTSRTARSMGLEGPELYEAPSVAARNMLELHKQGINLNTIPKARDESWRTLQASVNKAKTVVGNQTDPSQTIISNAVKHGDPNSASRIVSKMSVPLMALGGVVGLLAAVRPNTGLDFKQGARTEETGLGQEDMIGKYSEIPGNADMSAIWYGSSAPFALNLNFRGFVADRREEESLKREVFNILTSNLEVKKVSGDVQNRRNREHRQAAIEAARGAL